MQNSKKRRKEFERHIDVLSLVTTAKLWIKAFLVMFLFQNYFCYLCLILFQSHPRIIDMISSVYICECHRLNLIILSYKCNINYKKHVPIKCARYDTLQSNPPFIICSHICTFCVKICRTWWKLITHIHSRAAFIRQGWLNPINFKVCNALIFNLGAVNELWGAGWGRLIGVRLTPHSLSLSGNQKVMMRGKVMGQVDLKSKKLLFLFSTFHTF